MKKSEIILGLIRIPLDYLATFFAFVAAYIIRKNYPDILPGISLSTNLEVFQPWPDYLLFSSIAALILIPVFAVNNHYSLKSSSKIQNEVGNVFLSTSFWLIIIIAWFFFTRELFFSRLVLAYIYGFCILFVTMERFLIRILEKFLLKFNIGRQNILILGANNITAVLFDKFQNDPRFKVVGILAEEKIPQKTAYKIIGTIGEIKNIISRLKIDAIIQTKANLQNSLATDILDLCREYQIEYSFVPDLIDIHQKNIEVSPVAGIPLIHLKPTPLDGWGKVTKRIFDIMVSLVLLIILSPIMALAALAIKLDSKGTILFKYLDDGGLAKRVGQKGKLFRFFKFRSMHPNTHNLRYTKFAHLNTRIGTPMVKIKNDPRVTRVGRIIRKTSIDEFPQFWNVLIGNMSLVGPRAHLPEEVEQYEKHHKFVLTIKPGITGLAQISGRSDLHFDEEVKLDRYYIENWSLWLDIKILLKTFLVVINRSGSTD